MPTITISKKELLKNTGTINEEELKQKISFLGTDLEGIEGDEITIEIFPNRPDLLSQQGMNRAMKTFLGKEKGTRQYQKTTGEKNYKVTIEKEVQKVRPYTACAIIKGLEFNDQRIKDVIQIQEKLHVTYGRNRKRCAIGIYPLEHIKLPITYTAKKPEEIKFKPLEAEKEMTGKEILEKHPTGKEYAHLLEGEKKYPVFIDSNNKILSMPPIINSEETGRVTEKTKELFIECSGHEWEVVSKALNMIVTAMADMGGEIHEMTLEYPDKKIKSPELEPERITIKKDYLEKYLGFELTEKELEESLGRMGISIEKKGKEYEAKIPCYRSDIIHPIDLVEETAIGYGMDKIESNKPRIASVAEEEELERFKNKIREILISCGLMETKSYNLVPEETQTTMIEQKENKKRIVQVKEAASKEYNTLRNNITASNLIVLRNNKHHSYPQKIFEIGETFEKNKEEETGVKEEEKLAVTISGEETDYTRIRQILDALMEALGLEARTKPTENKTHFKGRTGAIMIKQKEIGVIGEINPQVLENFEITMPTASFEISLEKLYEEFKKEQENQ